MRIVHRNTRGYNALMGLNSRRRSVFSAKFNPIIRTVRRYPAVVEPKPNIANIEHISIQTNHGAHPNQKRMFTTRHYNPSISARRANLYVEENKANVIVPKVAPSSGSGAYHNQKRYFTTRFYNPIFRRTLRYIR